MAFLIFLKRNFFLPLSASEPLHANFTFWTLCVCSVIRIERHRLLSIFTALVLLPAMMMVVVAMLLLLMMLMLFLRQLSQFAFRRRFSSRQLVVGIHCVLASTETMANSVPDAKNFIQLLSDALCVTHRQKTEPKKQKSTSCAACDGRLFVVNWRHTTEDGARSGGEDV